MTSIFPQPDASYSEDECAFANDLFERHYDELKAIARANRRQRRISDTLQTVDILHDAFLKLRHTHQALSPDHFKRVTALAIRQVIVDYARRKLSTKRGGGANNLPLEENAAVLPEFTETPEDILIVSSLLRELAQENERWLRILDLRYFAGFTEQETAEALDLNVRTIRRDWRAIKAWLAPRMGLTTGE